MDNIQISGKEDRDLRELILDNAFEIVKKLGLTHTSISKIVALTHISKTTFYRLFSSKEEMVYELCCLQAKRSLCDFNKKLNGREKMSKAEGKKFIRFIIMREDTIYRFLNDKDWAGLRQVLSSEQMAEIGPPSREESMDNMKNILMKIQGIPSNIDIEKVNSVIGLLIFSYMHWMKEKPDISWERLSNVTFEYLIQLLFKESE